MRLEYEIVCVVDDRLFDAEGYECTPADHELRWDPGYYAVFHSGTRQHSRHDGRAFLGPFPDAAAASRVAQLYPGHAVSHRATRETSWRD